MLVLGAFGASACSLLLPFQELSDGTTTPAEAGAEPLDAAGDAGPYPDDSWCATQPPLGMTFCDDFDFETTAFERWTSQTFDVQGSASFSDVAESPPHSFQMSMPAITAGTYVEAVLEENVAADPSASSVSLSFSFQPAEPWDAGEGGDIYVAAFQQGPGIPRSAVALQMGPSGTSLSEQVTVLDGGSLFPPFQSSPFVPPAGQWTHVAIEMNLASSTATVSLDGAVAFTLTLSGPWSPSVSTRVYLGDTYVTATAGFDVLYDDAVIRRH
jgi:hypothetical protein